MLLCAQLPSDSFHPQRNQGSTFAPPARMPLQTSDVSKTDTLDPDGRESAQEIRDEETSKRETGEDQEAQID